MVAPGNITGRFKPQRVSSSTCNKPQQSTADATVGLVDFSDPSVTTADKFMCGRVEAGDYSADLCDYFGQ
jgi:hypothetical protein